jgi:hypothetical protein
MIIWPTASRNDCPQQLWDYQDTGTGRDSEQGDDIITYLDLPVGSY